jgi:hypothetical protein
MPDARLVWRGSPGGDPVKPVDRDELAKQQKLVTINEALRADLSRHRRMSHVALLLVAVLNVVVLAVLAYHLLSHA